MRRQEPLLEAVDELYRVIDEENSGYAGVKISVDDGTVDLYWHGRLPAAVRRAARGLDTPDRRIVLHGAPYTWRQLTDEANRLMRQDRGVVQVGIRSDGRGLRVQFDRTLSKVRPLQVDSRVASTVTWGSAIAPASRWADISPFWGGSVITSSENSCTTGFAGTSSIGPTSVLITAFHCGLHSWETPFGNTVGDTFDQSAAASLFDIETISAPSGAFAYMAGTDFSGVGTGETFDPVSASRPSPGTPAGTMICADGGFSGERCDAQVDGSVQYTLDDTPGFDFVGLQVTQLQNVNLFGQGDSGGPVITLNGSSVTAEGIISGGDPDHVVPCTGVPLTRTCFSQGVYAPIHGVATIDTTVKTTS